MRITNNKIHMTEQAEKYRAISEMAALLRETTQKRAVTSYKEDDEFPDVHVQYYNTVFNDQEHADVKRAFLRLCGEI